MKNRLDYNEYLTLTGVPSYTRSEFIRNAIRVAACDVLLKDININAAMQTLLSLESDITPDVIVQKPSGCNTCGGGKIL